MEGIAFHGSGGLLYYYLGIARFIQETYNLDNIDFCGVSGGCLPSVLLSSKMDVDSTWRNCFQPWIRELSGIKNNGAILSIFSDDSIEILRENFKKELDEKTIMKNVNRRLSIRMSRVSLFATSQIYINHWDSIDDLLECVLASCWLPGLFGRLTKFYKGYEYIDGGFPNTIENRGSEWLHIRIDTFQHMQDDMKLLLYCMSLTTLGSVDVAHKLYDMGYSDAQKHKNFFYKLEKNELSSDPIDETNYHIQSDS